MGQSKISSYSDKSFSNSRCLYERQFTFNENCNNQQMVNNALKFSCFQQMIHDGLYINGLFISNFKMSINNKYVLKEINLILSKENKLMIFQHEFQRISKDPRFKSESYMQNTTIEKVDITELQNQVNNTLNLQMLDSFGTNNSGMILNQRGRQSNKIETHHQQSSEEDFSDFSDHSRSQSPFNSQLSSKNVEKKSIIIKKNFPSDSDSGDQQRELKDKQILIKNSRLSNGFQQQEQNQISILQQQDEDDSREQELVNQVNTDLRKLKSKIESNIGPSYKELDQSNYTSNYQKLINQQKTKSSNKEQEQNLIHSQQSIQKEQKYYRQQQKQQSSFHQEDDSYQKVEKQKPSQIQSISIKVNQNQTTQKYRPIVSKEYQINNIDTPNSSIYKPPWAQNQASILSYKSNESENKKSVQPINIKIDFKNMQKKGK